MLRFLVLLVVAQVFPAAHSQSLPTPSRTVYKCQQAGKLVYSDSPCPGAERLDIEPTRGMDKSSGTSRVGADVARERQRELTAEAFKPLTGMDAKQLDRAGRRMKLAPAVQERCRRLDASIPVLEVREAKNRGDEAVIALLFKQRSEFRELRCD